MPQDRPLKTRSPADSTEHQRRPVRSPAKVRAPPSQPGTYFLGRYRVVDEIGIGGMASVHLARMDGPGGFQKWVAIKRIHPHLVEDDTFVHMFLDEANVAARISHPNVATVFELGKHEDTYWIAMEYLHGEPLREVMRRTEELGQPMPPEIACRVIAEAADGLHAAHELQGKDGEKLNLIHRDVTPHNLFVTYDGITKVVDFGIAKFSSRMASTRAGTLKGKLAYMSPEQVQGEPIDRRTDIFALGVVLWELTTGQRLFRMDSDLDTLAKVQECNIPRPSTLVRGYPIDLEKIVMKALAKSRAERFEDRARVPRRDAPVAPDASGTVHRERRDRKLRPDHLQGPDREARGAPALGRRGHADDQRRSAACPGADARGASDRLRARRCREPRIRSCSSRTGPTGPTELRCVQRLEARRSAAPRRPRSQGCRRPSSAASASGASSAFASGAHAAPLTAGRRARVSALPSTPEARAARQVSAATRS